MLVAQDGCSANWIGSISDLEPVALGHHHSYARLPPGALTSGQRSGPHAGGPRRWVRYHLFDQGLDTIGDELVQPDCPPANWILRHGLGRGG